MWNESVAESHYEKKVQWHVMWNKFYETTVKKGSWRNNSWRDVIFTLCYQLYVFNYKIEKCKLICFLPTFSITFILRGKEREGVGLLPVGDCRFFFLPKIYLLIHTILAISRILLVQNAVIEVQHVCYYL